MRFYHDPQPLYGENRIRQKFLWFPKTIGNTTVWLEKARWMEIFKRGVMNNSWYPVNWCDVDYQRGSFTERARE